MRTGPAFIGQIPAIVTSVEMSAVMGEFAKVRIEFMLARGSDLNNLDFSQIFQSPSVSKAINQEIQRQTRKISFVDR